MTRKIGNTHYDFKGHPDGASPEAKLIAVNNELYDTTCLGGSNSYKRLAGGGPSTDGCGTVFEVSTAGKETVLYAFKGPAGHALRLDEVRW